MSANPTVTVVMVTYNSARYVGDAIRSVLAQDFPDFELLICDDHSTDSTWSVVQSFDDPRIRAIRHPENMGEYPNRNHAIQQARGRLLVFLDGDDVMYSHGLGFMVRMLESCTECAFASAQPPSPKFIYPVRLTPHQFYACQYLGPNVTAANFAHLIFRTEHLRKLGGFDARFRSGDTHVQYRLAMSHPCLLISDGLAWWREYPGQASQDLLRDLWGLAELTCYGQELLAHPECPLDASERQLGKTNLLRLFLRNVQRYVRRGHVRHAWRLLQRANVPVKNWHLMFADDHRPYLKNVDGAKPFSATRP